MSTPSSMDTVLMPADEGLPFEVASWVEGDGMSAFSLVPRAEDALTARRVR